VESTTNDSLHVLCDTLQQCPTDDVPYLEEPIRTHSDDLVGVLQELTVPNPLRMSHQSLRVLESFHWVDAVYLDSLVGTACGKSTVVIAKFTCCCMILRISECSLSELGILRKMSGLNYPLLPSVS